MASEKPALSEMSEMSEMTVPVDRRRKSDRRKGADRRQKESDSVAQRRTSGRGQGKRRRHIDPTTCERDYSPDEIEFMQALDNYKHQSGRMFPTCSEILEVIHRLGYVKQREGQTEPSPPAISAEQAEPNDEPHET